MITNRLTYTERAQYCTNPVAKKLFRLMDDKQSNLALSADVTTSQALLELADQIGPEICILKTHIDIIADFSEPLITELKSLAKKHQFLIFEDRKFADIGNTVQHQYQGGIYRIAEWADIINAHSLPGPGIVQGLAQAAAKNERALLLLAEMSSTNNLITTEYTQKTIAMAKQFPDFVIGFISQTQLSTEPQWLYLTPGVQFTTKNDPLGQHYITPEQAITENQSDIIIVGRGILQSKTPKSTAESYRKAAWQAHIERT